MTERPPRPPANDEEPEKNTKSESVPKGRSPLSYVQDKVGTSRMRYAVTEQDIHGPDYVAQDTSEAKKPTVAPSMPGNTFLRPVGPQRLPDETLPEYRERYRSALKTTVAGVQIAGIDTSKFSVNIPRTKEGVKSVSQLKREAGGQTEEAREDRAFSDAWTKRESRNIGNTLDRSFQVSVPAEKGKEQPMPQLPLEALPEGFNENTEAYVQGLIEHGVENDIFFSKNKTALIEAKNNLSRLSKEYVESQDPEEKKVLNGQIAKLYVDIQGDLSDAFKKDIIKNQSFLRNHGKARISYIGPSPQEWDATRPQREAEIEARKKQVSYEASPAFARERKAHVFAEKFGLSESREALHAAENAYKKALTNKRTTIWPLKDKAMHAAQEEYDSARLAWRNALSTATQKAGKQDKIMARFIGLRDTSVRPEQIRQEAAREALSTTESNLGSKIAKWAKGGLFGSLRAIQKGTEFVGDKLAGAHELLASNKDGSSFDRAKAAERYARAVRIVGGAVIATAATGGYAALGLPLVLRILRGATSTTLGAGAGALAGKDFEKRVNVSRQENLITALRDIEGGIGDMDDLKAEESLYAKGNATAREKNRKRREMIATVGVAGTSSLLSGMAASHFAQLESVQEASKTIAQGPVAIHDTPPAPAATPETAHTAHTPTKAIHESAAQEHPHTSHHETHHTRPHHHVHHPKHTETIAAKQVTPTIEQPMAAPETSTPAPAPELSQDTAPTDAMPADSASADQSAPSPSGESVQTTVAQPEVETQPASADALQNPSAVPRSPDSLSPESLTPTPESAPTAEAPSSAGSVEAPPAETAPVAEASHPLPQTEATPDHPSGESTPPEAAPAEAPATVPDSTTLPTETVPQSGISAPAESILTNTRGVSLNTTVPSAYSYDVGNGKSIAVLYGGTEDTRVTAAQKYLRLHPSSTIRFETALTDPVTQKLAPITIEWSSDESGIPEPTTFLPVDGEPILPAIDPNQITQKLDYTFAPS